MHLSVDDHLYESESGRQITMTDRVGQSRAGYCIPLC